MSLRQAETAELVVEGLGKSFAGRAVLSGIDLQVPSGSLLAVLGASGGGKTTLLRLLCGFERADAGSIRVGGRLLAGDGLHVPAHRRRIGYVAQDGALFPHLTVAGNVLFGLPRALRRDLGRAAALLEAVGLPARFATRQPHELSGGEQQRVALARALAPSPALVLLDEPFSALDAALREETRSSVAAALAAVGATAVLVTHDQAEALSLGHQVAVLRSGRMVQVATPDVLYRQPADAALAGFIGEAVLLPGEADGARVHCALGSLHLLRPAHGRIEVMIRPEQIRLIETTASDDGPRGVVERAGFGGHDSLVEIRLQHSGELVSARVPGYAMPEPGRIVALRVEGAVLGYPA
ncbi:ABC transporter ATP-binding protein [Lichenicoccus roseus]|uniref:ABC transporter ATP-binding protein n=1 Tax=Lichenicoccus roseus TaxID=2683649 RepID=A0A5R9J8Q4_9PROT|nr:ABC transporter ATP-binding protein [Lichenicoccus roseus]TLU73369.1 ABC transporter ATP-binding protein [Lichenicoccus roseus]